jgi:hypothetical protein
MLENAINTVAAFSESLTLEWLAIILGIVGSITGVVALFFKWKGWRTAEDANKLSERANETAKKALDEAKEANRISAHGIPNIEFKYILKELESDYEGTKYYNYIQENMSKYGRKYHHLILVNGGTGQAVNWIDAWNWETFDGEERGFDYEKLPEGQITIHTNNLFPADRNVQIPALIARRDIFEEAKWLLILIKYSDMLGNKHCKCKQFIRGKEDRGYVQDSQKARYNIFYVNQPEDGYNRKKCADCCFDETIVEKEIR